MPDAGILATLLLLVGLFLLGLEFFVPSFGMILIIASISLIVSFWSAYKAWWGTNPFLFWTYLTVLVAGIPGSLFGAITLMQRTSFGSRFILRPVPSPEKLPPNPLEALIGRRGVTLTLMTPGGMVAIESERFHAESIGMVVEPKTAVIVVGAKANRIVVRPLTEGDDRAEISGLPAAEAQGEAEADSKQPSDHTETDRLDFDIPEGYTQGR